MNNKKLIYILITIITLFSFNMNVNAAKELTCVYERENGQNITLIQYKTGKKDIYWNKKGITLNDEWEKNHYATFKFNYTTLDNEGKAIKSEEIDELSECLSEVFYNSSKNYFYFTNIKSTNEKQPIKYEYVADFALAQVTVPQNTTNLETEMLLDIDDKSEYTGKKYTGSCKYKREIERAGYHYIQMNIGSEDILFTEYDPIKRDESGKNKNSKYQFNVDSKYTFTYFKEQYGGNCPSTIIVKRKISGLTGTDQDKAIHTTILKTYSSSSNDESTYILDSVSGYNPITNELLSKDKSYGDDIKFVAGNITNCKQLFGEKLYGYFNVIWNLVKIGIPIILIGLGIADFAQAIFSGKEDNMKKAQGKFIKRVVIAIVIFLIPTLIGLLLNIANEVWPNIGTDICGIVF